MPKHFYTKLYSWIFSRFNTRTNHMDKKRSNNVNVSKSNHNKRNMIYFWELHIPDLFILVISESVCPTNIHKMLQKLPQLVKLQNYQNTCCIKLIVSSSSGISVTPAWDRRMDMISLHNLSKPFCEHIFAISCHLSREQNGSFTIRCSIASRRKNIILSMALILTW